MKPRDPRIVGAGHRDLAGEKMALEQMQIENAIKSNPLFPMVAKLKEQTTHVLAQNRSTTIKLQALMDYLAHCGILLGQELDDDGFACGVPAANGEYKFFEPLTEFAGMELPLYGFSAYYVEHEKRTVFLIEMMTQVQKGIKKMDDVLEMVRNFNAEPKRIVPIAGVEFGLGDYLTHNPEGWDEEKCDTLAAEFGLAKAETEEEEDVADEGDKSEEAVVVPFERPADPEEDDAEPTS